MKSFLRPIFSIIKALSIFEARFKKDGSAANHIASFILNPTISNKVELYAITALIPQNTDNI